MNSLLFPILSIISAVGLYFFFISPNLEEISVLQVKNEEFSKSLEDVREIENIMAQLESSYASITKDDLIKLERFLPVSLDTTQAAYNLSTIIQAEGAILNIVDVSGQPIVTIKDGVPERLLENTAKVTFSADYSDFKKILESIENNLQVSRISLIEIGQPAKDDDLGLAQYTIGLIFYSYNVGN